jgi:hypothetical protein
MIALTQIEGPATGKVNRAKNQNNINLPLNLSTKIYLSRIFSGRAYYRQMQPIELTLTELSEQTNKQSSVLVSRSYYDKW